MVAETAASYAGARVLVAGATGFIGRAVAHALWAAGARLILPARDPGGARSLFEALEIEAQTPEWDATDDASVRAVLAEEKPDVVFNLLGYGIDPREREASLAQRLNDRLPGLFVEGLATAGSGPWPGSGGPWPGRRLVHVGSALEYGRAEGDLDESTEEAPETLYGRTKLDGTRRVAETAGRLGVEAVTGRLFTVYGQGERPGRLLPSLLEAVARARPLALTAGLQRRDFTYVEDAAEALLRLGRLNGPPGEVVNVATGALISVRDFARRAVRAAGGDPDALLQFGQIPTREEEMSHQPVSTARLWRRIGWRPGTIVEDGVRRTLAFRARYGAPPTS